MKDRHKTILLSILALLIWGYAGVEWFSYYQSNSSQNPKVYNQINASTFSISSTSKHPLGYNYEDPFLKNPKNHSTSHKSTSSISTVTKNTLHPKIIKPEKQKETKWPKIQFYGTINKLGIITINNKTYIIKPSDSIDQIEVLSFTKDEIMLHKGKTTKKIKKNININ